MLQNETFTYLGFRPLSGNKVSEQKWEIANTLDPLRFRPLSGNKVSELDNFEIYDAFYKSFRPLSGNKVSELYILCHPRHDILYIFFKGFLVSDTPLISTPYHTINT